MDDLNRKIKGDWFDIREVADNLYELEDVFEFSIPELQSLVSDLRLSVEQGVTEYKTKILQNLYTFLDSLQYDSKGFDTLLGRSRSFSFLVYSVLIQRLIAVGNIELKSAKQSVLNEEETQTSEQINVKEIMKRVQERIKEDPNMRQNAAIKNILMQMAIYRKELDQMKTLAPNILPEKKQSFLENFKKTFDDINEKIQEQYRTIETEEERKAAMDFVDSNPLKQQDLKPLGKILFEQAREFSQIRSTLDFAGKERFKTREILGRVLEGRERTLLLIATEQRQYTGGNGDVSTEKILGKAFGAELIRVLNRQITRIS